MAGVSCTGLSVKVIVSETNELSIVVGLHQVVTSNGHLFMIVVDELTNQIQGKPQCTLFTNYIILIDESNWNKFKA